MQIKNNDATTQQFQSVQKMGEPLEAINLQRIIDQVKAEQKWKETDRNTINILRTKSMRIVLMGLHQGAELNRRLASGMISLQVMEGLIIVDTDEQAIKLGKGQMLALHEGMQYSILAKEESVFLLTLTKTVVKI